MYRRVINHLRGNVTVLVQSPFPERVLNLCAAHAIPFWDLHWLDETTFSVHTSSHSLARLRALCAEGVGTLRVQSSRGIPPLLCSIRRRYALLAGFGLLLLFLFGGNLFIWDFRVTGNETVPTETILRALEEYGVTVGSVGLRIDQEALRNHVLLKLPDLSWLVVNVKGCTAHVQVVERQRPPQIVREDETTNVVAVRSGLVERIEALEGHAEVSAGSTVTRGQLLISGVVDGGHQGVRLLHGMGNVWARTWYELSVLVPLRQEEYTAETGETERIWLNWGKHRINLWTKGSILGTECGKILHYEAVCLPGGFRLPLTVGKECITRYETTAAQRSEEEAREEGKAALLALLDEQMTEGGSIRQTRFSSARKGDWLLVSLAAECSEQIGRQVVLPET